MKPKKQPKAAKAQPIAGKPQQPRKPGRPSKKTPETVREICERLAKGEPMARICRDSHMPDQSTVWDWCQSDNGVSQAIARAREQGEEVILADCLCIADDSGEDFRHGPKGTIVETDSVARSKLRVWTRLELLKKWNPKKWGDKQEIDHKSSDGSMSPLTEEQRKLLDKTLDGTY